MSDYVRFTIPGKTASGNMATRTANGRQYKPTAAAGYEAKVYGIAFEACQAQGWKMPYYVAVSVLICNGRQDVDNALKVLLDGLQGVVYINDSRILELKVGRVKDKQGTRTIVEARPVLERDAREWGYVIPKAFRSVEQQPDARPDAADE